VDHLGRQLPGPEPHRASDDTVSDLIQTAPGTNFYRELQLVYTVALLEAIDLDNVRVISKPGQYVSNPVGSAFAEDHGVYILYRLLLSIEDGGLDDLIEHINMLDDSCKGLAAELKNASKFGGGRIFHQIRIFLFAGSRPFSYWDHQANQEAQVTGDTALRALLRELRVYSLDPIFALGAYIRSSPGRTASFLQRFGGQPCVPYESVIGAVENHPAPLAIPYPRFR
jgi:hypothetical protein